jgi:hypothetical protein
MSEYPAGSTAKTYTGEDGVEISLREFVGTFPVQAVSLIRQQEIIISDTKAENTALVNSRDQWKTWCEEIQVKLTEKESKS